MDKTKYRRKAKALKIAFLIMRMESLLFKIKNVDKFSETHNLLIEYAQLRATLNNVKSTDWRVLTPKGKIDKRRIRRYVTKHRRLYTTGHKVVGGKCPPVLVIEEINKSEK